ncbi:MAG: transporter substrate-binding domain-containing protein [Candidatus Amulumruptor caecigallinarius]|nr:transporter substrate-binding domain-containing protein [Candidatus Amulumruptor caecigallinarius]MCM1396759.1 transporter substrate-binding domain-containing protein [Candidatus Amulumruptor caecigallinarius]MCM1453183.1 transporter substrate-binding domain-containing protein [bacterium]
MTTSPSSGRPSPIRGRLPLYLLLLVAAVALMLMLRECSMAQNGSARHRPAGGDTLNVAIEYSPMSLYRYADTLGGFNYDVMRAVATEAGMDVKFHPLTTVSQALEGLREGRYDVVVADVANTVDMQSQVRFTEPTFLDRQVLVQLRDSVTGKPPVSSQLQLAGDSVWVPDDEAFRGRVEALAREIGDSIHVIALPEYGAEQLVMLTATGQIPRAVVNEAVARKLAARYPGIDTSVGISFNQFQSWIVSPSNTALADTLDAALRRFKTTPAYRTLLRRYKK